MLCFIATFERAIIVYDQPNVYVNAQIGGGGKFVSFVQSLCPGS
jgi:hypothetical protein